MVLDGFQRRALVGAGFGQLNECLHDAGEQLVTPEAAFLQIGVDPALLPGLPAVHQRVDAVDERWGGAVGRWFAETADPTASDKVFDVIGRLIDNRSLGDYLLEALTERLGPIHRYGQRGRGLRDAGSGIRPCRGAH